MTFSTYYDSTDTGLGGIGPTAGSTISFLDKVLVNGYNSTTLTSMTQVGTLVTATLTNHGYRDRQFVTISGATPSGYNGTWQIVTGSTTANTFQFNTVSSGLSAATGTLGCIVAALGWTKAFSGTNLAAYKQPAGNALYINLDDTGTTSGKIVGFETMSAISTGTNPFPTVAQLATGTFLSKSASGTVRTILWGNSKVFYLFTDYNNNSSTGCLMMFGDGTSYKSGDVWFTTIMGNSAAGGTEGSGGWWGGTLTSNQFAAMAGHYIARSYTATAGAVTANKVGDLRFAGNSGGGFTPGVNAIYPLGGGNLVMNFPALVNGSMWTTAITVNETVATTPRGIMVGIIAPLHSKAFFTNYEFFTGTGGLAGKEYLVIYIGGGSFFAEVSNTF